MTTLTHLAAELFEVAGAESACDPSAYPCRQICREIVVRSRESTELIPAHTISVTPDSIEIDCKEELGSRQTVQVRLADAPDDAWSAAEVQHCIGTIIGYTVGLQMV